MAAALVNTFRSSHAGPVATESMMAERVDLIGSSQLFTGLSHSACQEIAARARARTFASDEMLYMQGQPARTVALIRTGSVKIMQLAPNGNEAILWMHGAGDVVGVLSEPNTSTYRCSSRAIEKTTALVWDNSTIQDLMQKYPQIRRNASLILASRLNELEERFREVATEKVARRVALALLRLLKHIGKEVHGGIQLSLSREELAQMTGTTLFTTSRILSQWGKLGFVLPSREGVLVRDAHRLEMAGEDDFENETILPPVIRNSARPKLRLVESLV